HAFACPKCRATLGMPRASGSPGKPRPSKPRPPATSASRRVSPSQSVFGDPRMRSIAQPPRTPRIVRRGGGQGKDIPRSLCRCAAGGLTGFARRRGWPEGGDRGKRRRVAGGDRFQARLVHDVGRPGDVLAAVLALLALLLLARRLSGGLIEWHDSSPLSPEAGPAPPRGRRRGPRATHPRGGGGPEGQSPARRQPPDR